MLRWAGVFVTAVVVFASYIYTATGHHDRPAPGVQLTSSVSTFHVSAKPYALRVVDLNRSSRDEYRGSLVKDKKTHTVKHRQSRKVQQHSIPAYVHSIPGYVAWASSPFVVAMRACEASGDYTKDTGNGYYGAYQVDPDFWTTYGGSASYLTPGTFRAPKWLQDLVAYKGYLARGYEPWPVCGQ